MGKNVVGDYVGLRVVVFCFEDVVIVMDLDCVLEIGRKDNVRSM